MKLMAFKAILSIVIGSGIYLLPSFTSNQKLIQFQQPLKITVANWAPSKAALREVFENGTVENQPTQVSNNVNLNNAQTSDWKPIEIVPDRHSDDELLKGLNERQKNRLQEAQLRHDDLLKQNWEIPNPKQILKQKIDEINKNLESESIAKNTTNIEVFRQNEDGTITTPADVSRAKVETNEDNQKQSYTLNGQILFAPGLILGDRNLEVRRFVEGIPVEPAKVDVQRGEFQIKVESLSGHIVAELFEKNGQMIASARHPISHMNNAFTPIKITLRDNTRIAGSFYNYSRDPEFGHLPQNKSVRGEKGKYFFSSTLFEGNTDELGHFEVRRMSPNSWGSVRAQSQGFAETVSLISAGENRNIPMLPLSTIKALLAIIDGFSDVEAPVEIEKRSIVWGQVLFDGKPLKDVSVKVLGFEDSQPIYLQNWIPNRQLSATEGDAHFVFLDLPSGMHTIEVEKDGQLLSHINVLVDQGAVAFAPIQVTRNVHMVDLKTYDAFNGNAVAAEIQLQSLREPMKSFGYHQAQLQVRKNFGIAQVTSQSEDYVVSRYVYDEEQNFIHMPLIRQNWIENIILYKRINRDPEKGMVIGFVSEDDFEVYIPHQDEYGSENIVYFDSYGNIAEHPVMGGGYILFNLDPIVQAVVTQGKKSGLINSQIIAVDPGTTNILKVHF